MERSAPAASVVSTPRATMAARGLPLVFLLRAAAGGALAALLLTRHERWAELFRRGAIYAVADGALGLVMATMILTATPPQPSIVGTITLVDAVTRLCVGLLLLAVPAIADLPMTVVPLLGATGLCAAALGLLALVAWVVVRRRAPRAQSLATEAFFDPMVAVATLSLVAGTRLFISPPVAAEELSIILVSGGIVLAASFAIAAVGGAARA